MLEKDELKLAQALQGLNVEELVATLGISQMKLLDAILAELILIRQATEQANEEEEGATHLGDLSHTFTPGATLNGP